MTITPTLTQPLKIVQINLNNCRAANQQLLLYISNNKIDLAIVQDYYKAQNSFAHLPLRWSFYQSSNKTAGILIANPNLLHVQAKQFSNSVFINISGKPSNLTIASLYSKPSSNLEEDLQEWSHQGIDSSNLIIGGDFNAGLKDYGYSRTSSRGDILLDYLAINNLTIINNPDTEFTYIHHNKKGNPDLTLAGTNIRNSITNWQADLTSDSLSDHIYVTYNIQFQNLSSNFYRFKTKFETFKKFNDTFKTKAENLHTSLNQISTVQQLNDWVENFQLQIIETMQVSLKKKKLSQTIQLNWFTEHLKIQRNRLNAHYKRYIRNKDNQDYKQTYYKLKAKYKLEIKEAKKKAWISFCSTSNTKYGTAFNILRRKYLKNTDLIHTLLDSSLNSDAYTEIQEDLFNHHFGSISQEDRLTDTLSHQIFTQDSNQSPFTLKEIIYCSRKQNSKKAPGYDRIDARVLNNIIKNFPNLILNLYNLCKSLGCFPSAWKRGILLFFHKSNKDPKNPASYRPITLLPMFGKLLERLIKLRVMASLESSNFLDNDQHGFRENLSTITALQTLITRIQSQLTTNKYTAIVSFDIQGAFDSIHWKTIATILDQSPISHDIKNLLLHFIHNRYMGFESSEGITWHQIFKGCPQGSCLGPLLWTLIADSLLKNYKRSFPSIQAYADDFVIISSGNTRSQLETSTNDRIDLFNRLCKDLDLQISSAKTKAMLFGGNTLSRRHPIFKLNNSSIPVAKTLTYLGIILDAKFKFIDHLKSLKNKTLIFLQGFKNFKTYQSGISPTLLKFWYKTVTYKQITYGYQIWLPNLNSHGIRRLNSLQRLALLSILKVYRSTSTSALCVLSGIIPIYIQLTDEFQAYEVQQGKRSIQLFQTDISKSNLMLPTPTHAFPEYFNIQNLHTIEDHSQLLNSPDLQIFTDGSKTTDGTASAIAIFYKNKFSTHKSYRHHQLNSVFQSELFAIYTAISWFASSLHKSVLILTDSQSSFKLLQNPFPTNQLSINIYKILKQIPQKIIYLTWIKAHAGTEGNEKADSLAKQATNITNKAPIKELKFPKTVISSFFKEHSIERWQADWSSSTKGRETYKILKEIDIDFICNFPSQTNYLSGHGSFPVFLFKIGKLTSPQCQCSKADGSVFHYIFGQCSQLPYHFKFNRHKTVRQNLQRILLNPANANKLIHNYNKLNELYSFIRTKLHPHEPRSLNSQRNPIL